MIKKNIIFTIVYVGLFHFFIFLVQESRAVVSSNENENTNINTKANSHEHNYKNQDNQDNQDNNKKNNKDEEQLVEVEVNPLISIKKDGDKYLPPYGDRRFRFGFNMFLDFEDFIPSKYSSDYKDIYGSNESKLIELAIAPRWNHFLGSFSLNLSGGLCQSESNYGGNTNDLSLTIFKIGLEWALDNLLSEPYIIPYIGASFVQTDYNEKGINVRNGSSTGQVSYIGLLFQMNWLDPKTAFVAYKNGIENTYISAELKTYSFSKPASTSDEKRDFSMDNVLALGLRLEFR